MFSGTQHKWLVLVAIAALAAFVIACGTDETKLVKDDSNGGVGAQPVETPVEAEQPLPDDGIDTVDELAPIESVQILVLESYPEQFVVQIVSGIPNGCASFSHTEVSQDGTDIYISVYNSVPAPDQLAFIACAAIYGIHEESVALGSDFERGTVFSVHVNDHPAATFETGASPVGDPLPPYEDPGFEIVPAPVENFEIFGVELGNGQTGYFGNVFIGLTSGCNEPVEPNVVRTSDNGFEVFPVAKVPTGDVMCTSDYRIAAVEVQFGTVGEELKACSVYEVTAGEFTTQFQAIAPNVRCADPGLPTATPSPLPGGGGSIIADSHALELTLIAEGAEVEYSGASSATLFGFESTELVINGTVVSVYEFAPGTSAEEASSRVSGDGSSLKGEDGVIASISWIATPHFYLFGNAIIVYVGDDAEIGDLLASATGGQFAGGEFGDAGSGEDAGDWVTRSATVEQVTLASTRSIPAQHLVNVTILLSSGCEEFHSIDYHVEGREVYIDVLTQVPAEPMPCILMVSYEDHSINIGSEYEAGVEYDVIVNGERQGTFTGG